jgi:undecaprenyl-diphosphatase
LDLLQAISLALLQGITEFLPISSSAHLMLPSQLLGWPDQGLAFDTAVHLGSLIAVVWYFRQEIMTLLNAVWTSSKTGQMSTDSRYAFNLLIASLPIIPVGFIFRFDIEEHLRSVEVIIATTIIFGILLLVADFPSKKRLDDRELNWKQALLIGISQCLALIPGTSRSGITMSAALLVGFTREASSRISFLISIPTIAGAAVLKMIDLLSSSVSVDWTLLAIGTVVSMLSAYICIMLFLNLIARIGFLPFVVYRFALGGLLIILISF